ncbi:translocation/assembly module TamB domain-containing protein [Sphaerotilus sp.]|uniref:translocation/assembly module TamB domain-containing protein n=1 Tax=Sphaerotilus sp. TaxID=2093942 RepID=UPI00286E99AF|nr:translocation/assembly module TamB domain-containing protein [Sphaerotilus sp.]
MDPVLPEASARQRQARWSLWPLLAVLVLLAFGLVAGLYAALASESGSRWLLGLVPGLQSSGVRGCLLDDFDADQLRYRLNARQVLQIDQLRWRGVQLRWPEGKSPLLSLAQLSIGHLDLQGSSGNDDPPVLPTTLNLPISVQIGKVRIDQLSVDALRARPVRELSAALSLQAGRGGAHRVDALQLRWDRLALHGLATLGADAPMPLDVRLVLTPDTAASGTLEQDWRVDLRAHGPLQQIAIDTRLVARGQSLDVQAEVRPDQRQPLSHLQARLQALDLAPFASGLPTTALSGQIDARLDNRTSAAQQRLQVQVDLQNLRPGSWAHHHVPVDTVKVTASGDLRNPDTGTLDALLVSLHDGSESAGTVLGSGRWALSGTGTQRRLDAALSSTWQDLHPARLDPRAPAVRVSGPLTLTYGQSLGGNIDASRRVTLHTDLRGQLVGAGLPEVRLLLQAQATPQRIDLEQLQARSGAARLDATGHAEQADAHWLVQLKGDLDAFDPSLWWPGETQALGPRGSHRLGGQLDADLRIPVHPTAGLAGLAEITGSADLHIDPSLIAGVPLAGQLKLQTRTGTASAAHWSLDLKATAGAPAGAAEATELHLAGDLTTPGAEDHWALQWKSNAPERLNPWMKLAGAGTQVSGDTQGELELTGRWPRVRSTGQLRSAQLRLPQADLQGLDMRWKVGTFPSDTIDLGADVATLRIGTQRLAAFSLRTQGTAASHQLQLRSQIDVPARAEMPARRLQALLALDGGLADEIGPSLENRDAGLRWNGKVAQLELRDAAAATAGPMPSAPPPPLLQLDPAPLSLVQNANGLAAKLGASRLTLMDAQILLDSADWHSGSAPHMGLRARLSPLRVAPLLARAQPDFGWGGDLTLGGRIELQSTPEQFTADIALQRDSGDLSVEDPDLNTGPRRLGLADLKLRLNAAEGVWRLTQLVSGGNLGSLNGQQTVRTDRHALWPAADAPVAGQIDLQIAQLGNWGRWLPPGWRLSGQLATEARVGGTFGAPAFSGELNGSQIAVRNTLQGVDWTDARLKVLLAGETARIDTFSVRAGAGTLSARGEATLGAAPRLTVKVTADHFAALQRVDRKVVVSGEADLGLDAQSTQLKGRVRADEGRFDFTQSDAPGLADDVEVDRGRGDARARDTATTSRRTTTLDLRVDLGDAFVLRGRGLNTRLAGELRLTSPANRLAIHGNIRAVDGTYAAYGQKLRVERSIIAFTGVAENPRLDIEAVRPDLEDVRVGVTVTGTAQNPRIRLFSEPTMTDTDRLSWLILGRASDGLGRTDLALLQRAAYALIAGESDSPSLVERIGLDQLSVRQDGEGDTRETVVTLGKQISRRWYVGYERSLNAASGTWQLIYRAAQRFTLRAQSGAENALDLIWTWKWGPQATINGSSARPAAPSSP